MARLGAFRKADGHLRRCRALPLRPYRSDILHIKFHRGTWSRCADRCTHKSVHNGVHRTDSRNSADDAVEKITKILHDAEFRRAISAAQRKEASAHFDGGVVAPQWQS